MTTASFTISAFGDEIAPDLESQLQTLNDLKIPCLELRAAWGQNVLHMSDERVAKARALCDDARRDGQRDRQPGRQKPHRATD